MHVVIREAAHQDAAALGTLLVELGLFSSLKGQSAQAVIENVGAQLGAALSSPSHTLLVAEGGGTLVGYAAVHWLPHLFHKGPDGYLSELFVLERARGQGVGGALLARVTAEAKARRCPRLQLINFRNRTSYERGFYAKQGWTEQPDAARFVLYLTP